MLKMPKEVKQILGLIDYYFMFIPHNNLECKSQ